MRALHAGVRDTVAGRRRGGVPVYAGTDAGGGIRHGRIVDEIAALHDGGLTGRRRWAAASWAARDWLGRPGLVPGAPADLLVYARPTRGWTRTLSGTRRCWTLRGRVL